MYVTYGIKARVEALGPIWTQNDPTYFVSELMVDFFLVITEINKSTLFDNTGTLRCTKHKYLFTL